MKIHNWQIWHTYSTYSDNKLSNLEDIAKLLVEKEIALCSLHCEGRTYWREKNLVRSGYASPYDEEKKTVYEVISDDGKKIDLSEVAWEFWYQGTLLSCNEMKLFPANAQLLPKYIRAYLGECELLSEHEAVKCYPMIKIFENGIMIISFRVVSNHETIDLEDFIDNCVNLGQHKFNDFLMLIGIAKYAPMASMNPFPSKTNFLFRNLLNKIEKNHIEEIDKQTLLEECDPLPIKKAPMSRFEEDKSYDNLSTIAFTIFDTISYVISKPRQGLMHIFLGRKPHMNIGMRYVARPHIYLIDFDNQAEKAIDNELQHHDSILKIISNSYDIDLENPNNTLPKNLRYYSDYNAYLTSSASLWIWSKSGIRENSEEADLNFGHITSGSQVIVEILEYGNMLHRYLLDSSHGLKNADEVLKVRRILAEFKLQLTEASFYGEINELLKEGLVNIGTERINTYITENLSIRASETALLEARSSEKIRRTLTIIFGLIAVPRVVSDIIIPIGQKFHLNYINDEYKVFLIIILYLIVTPSIWLYLRINRLTQ